jgi:hypothetical protein
MRLESWEVVRLGSWEVVRLGSWEVVRLESCPTELKVSGVSN